MLSEFQADPANCSMMEDGFIGSQMQARINGRKCHAVGTRFPADTEVSTWQLAIFHTELEERARSCGGEVVMQTMVKTRELVLFMRVPTTVSETEFISLVEDFKEALGKADILYCPIMCPIDKNLRFLFEKKR